jgi:hypothetical protein
MINPSPTDPILKTHAIIREKMRRKERKKFENEIKDNIYSM